MQYVISKPIHSIGAGHIYEHIFVDALTQHLREAGFFSYVDYDIDAKTFHSGSVLIDIQLYNDETNTIVKEFIASYSNANISDDDIDGALLQLMAEFKADITHLEHSKLRQQIGLVAESPWVLGKWSPPTHWELDDEAISFNVNSVQETKTLTQEIRINRKGIDSSLEPLAIIVCKAVRNNLIEDITAQTYCFTHDDRFEVTDEELADTNVYLVDSRQSSKITIEPDISSTFLEKALHGNFAERLANSLKNADINSDDYPVMNELESKLNKPVALNVWQDTATAENISKILGLLYISFSIK